MAAQLISITQTRVVIAAAGDQVSGRVIALERDEQDAATFLVARDDGRSFGRADQRASELIKAR